MNLKGKGIAAERELIHLLWKQGFAAVRVASSGSSRYPSCDILASNGVKTFCFECKSIKGKSRYIEKGEIDEFLSFSASFGGMPFIAARFSATQWHFLSMDDIPQTTKAYCISRDLIKQKGLLLEELLSF